MTTIAFVGIGPRSKCPQAQLRLNELSKRYCRAIVARPSSCPRRGRGVTYGSGTTAPGGSRPRRYVVDAVDADEAIDGCSEPRLWRLQLNITRHGFVGGCGTGRRRRSDVLYAIDAGGGVVADLGAWRGASTIGCALWGASGPRHCKPYIRRALWFSNERRGDYRRLS